MDAKDDSFWKLIVEQCDKYGFEIMDATPECPAGIWIKREDGTFVEWSLEKEFPEWFDENGELIL